MTLYQQSREDSIGKYLKLLNECNQSMSKSFGCAIRLQFYFTAHVKGVEFLIYSEVTLYFNVSVCEYLLLSQKDPFIF